MKDLASYQRHDNVEVRIGNRWIKGKVVQPRGNCIQTCTEDGTHPTVRSPEDIRRPLPTKGDSDATLKPGDKLLNGARVLLTHHQGHEPEHGIVLCDYIGQLVTWRIWRQHTVNYHSKTGGPMGGVWLAESGCYFDYDESAKAARSFLERSVGRITFEVES